MTSASTLKRNLALVAFFSLVVALLPFGPHVSVANASTGQLLVTLSGGETSSPGTNWSYTPATGVLSVTGVARISPVYLSDRLEDRNLTVEADLIVVADDVVATSNAFSLTLSATGDIDVEPGVALTTLGGGNISLLADSDGDGAGGIRIGLEGDSDALLTSNGGDITLAGGGDGTTGSGNTGFAGLSGFAATVSAYRYSIGLLSATVDAGGGNVVVKGYGGSSDTGLVWCVQIMDTIITSGSGTVLISGDCGSTPANLTANNSRNSWATRVEGTIQTVSGAITLVGRANVARTNARGFSLNGSVQTASGPIVVRDETANTSSANYTGPYLNGVRLGKGTLPSSSSNVTLIADKMHFGPEIHTSGSLVVEPAGSDFQSSLTVLASAVLTNLGNLTLGTANVTKDISLQTSITVSGTLEIHSDGAVTQTEPITAPALSLAGEGSYTLTNTSNAIGTVAAGSSSSKVGALSLYDASGGLTIGQVGALEGVTATGDVLIETGAGDITLARSIATDSTSSTAITVNAGKSTAAGTGTGGDIVVSGSPALTAGTGGIVRMFSGTDSGSTGLTALVGGASNTYTGVDETSTLSPALVSGTKYALYRSTPTSGGSSSGSSSSSPALTPVVPAPSAAPRPTRPVPVVPNTNPVPRPVERLGFVFDPDSPSRATVGGVPSNLVKTPVGPDGLSLTAGAFQFGVSLAEAEGAEVQTETPSQSPEMFVPRGQSAAVSGSGSYPGSFVQLWLPNGTTSRELARIPVRADGTFTSDVSFAAGSLEMPVPIGRQVLQVVGYDERGNQTVVDMTIDIGQGAPAPQPNRQVGELPALAAGQSLGTSGGMPEAVSVTGLPDSGSVVVEGSGWVVNVSADRDNGVVENADGNVLVRLDQSSRGTTSGSGFLPGTLATVWLFSEPTLMATVTVDDNGEFSSEFLVDARLIAPGEHTLQVQGVGSDGYIKAANLGVLVEQPVEVTAESASGLLWWIVGAFLLVLLFLLLLLARRRRSQEQ